MDSTHRDLKPPEILMNTQLHQLVVVSSPIDAKVGNGAPYSSRFLSPLSHASLHNCSSPGLPPSGRLCAVPPVRGAPASCPQQGPRAQHRAQPRSPVLPHRSISSGVLCLFSPPFCRGKNPHEASPDEVSRGCLLWAGKRCSKPLSFLSSLFFFFLYL